MKLFLLLAILLSGCSSHQLNTREVASIKTLGTEVSLSVQAPASIQDTLFRKIQAQLIINGFNISDAPDATKLQVVVSAFDPGNAALRLTVGFGAGRGSLLYSAKYLKNGKVLISYNGNERFTGMEIRNGIDLRTLSGEEGAKAILIDEAAENIVSIGMHN